MPIVISRKTGEIIRKPEYTQEERNKLWEHLVESWIEHHPVAFAELVKGDRNEEE